MELPTPWSYSTNGGGVLEHLFCSSKTTQYEPPRGVGGKLPTTATDYTENGSILFLPSPRAVTPSLPCRRLPPPPPWVAAELLCDRALPSPRLTKTCLSSAVARHRRLCPPRALYLSPALQSPPRPPWPSERPSSRSPHQSSPPPRRHHEVYYFEQLPEVSSRMRSTARRPRRGRG